MFRGLTVCHADRIGLVCTGLGRVRRGYESFAGDLFAELRESASLTLLKGGGPATSDEIVVRNLPRDQSLSWLSHNAGRAYSWEQRSFAIGMLPALIAHRFSILHYMDGGLTGPLVHLRRLGFRYKLLFKNGGAHTPEHYDRADFVQLLTPMQFEEARQHGIDARRLFCVPLGLNCATYSPPANRDRAALRRAYGVPEHVAVVLCVSALNYSDKRVDWVIREIAEMPGRSVFLLIAGQPGAESAEILSLAAALLPGRHRALAVPFEQVRELYWLADALALGSTREGFARVIPEAASAGLPLCAHDSEHFRWMTGHAGSLVDMTRRGALSERLQELLQQPGLANEMTSANQRHARRQFDWSVVRSRYLAMYDRVLSP